MMQWIEQMWQSLWDQLHSNDFLSGGLILGVLTGILMSMKSIPFKIWDRVKRKILFRVTIAQEDRLYSYLQVWLNEKYSKHLCNVKASINTETVYPGKSAEFTNHSVSKSSIENQSVVYNHYGDVFHIWYAGRFIRIQSQKEKIEKAQSLSQLFYESFFVEGLLAKEAIQLLLEEVVRLNVEREKKRVIPRIFINLGFADWHEEKARLRNLDTVFLPESVKNTIINDIKDFFDGKEFYLSRNLPYRRGYLLYGPPGTGKSSLVSALANHFRKDLFVMNLKAMEGNLSFERSLNNVSGGFLLIEDIDRYEFNTKKGVDYSTFINALSGVRAKEDLLLIITTNHRSKLDEALLRSGRIDVHLEIGLPTLREVNSYLSWFYNRKIELTEFIGNMADIENVCVRNKHNPDAALSELGFLKNKVVNQ